MGRMTAALVGLIGCLLPLSAAASEPLAVFECRERLGRDWPATLVTHERSFQPGVANAGWLRLVDGRWAGGSYFFAAGPDQGPRVTGYACRIAERGRAVEGRAPRDCPT